MAQPGGEGTIVVVAGGDPLPADHRRLVPAGALVIAADSGVDHAQAVGLHVDVAIGDLDSVSPAGLERAEAEGAAIERHPVAKDATDLELALDAAVCRGAARVVVLGGAGGRLDHLLGNVALLTAPRYASVEVVAHVGEATLTVVRQHAQLHGAPGAIVSLLAPYERATGVSTEGLLYPLRGEELRPGSTRGISNEMLAASAAVAVAHGVVLAVQPGKQPTDPQHRSTQP